MMQVEVIERGGLEAVEILGAVGKVTASSAGRTWTVADPAPRWRFTDPLAPLAGQVTYQDGETSVTVDLASKWRMVLASPDRGTIAPFIMPHEWTSAIEPTVDVVDLSTSRPFHRFGRVAKEREFPIQARCDSAGTAAMLDLLRSQTEVILLHNPVLCQLPGCPVPDVEAGVLLSGPGQLEERFDEADMTFQLGFQPIVIPSEPVAVTNWWDVKQAYETWWDVAQAGSWFDI